MKTRDFIINMLFACCAMGTVACSDEAEQTPVPDREATIYLNFKTAATEPHSGIRALQQAGTPATELWMDAGTADSAPTEGKMTAGTTRAPMTRAVNEDGIQTVDLLAFKTGSNPNDIKQGTFFYRVRGEYDPANRSVKVRLISDPHAQTLVLVANARDKVDRLAAALGEAKEDVMKRLLVSATADGQPDLSSGYMPMWGELPNQTIDPNYGNGTSATAPKTTVTMIRPVAKVTLKCSDAPGKSFFGKFEELRLYNYRSKGRISPDNCTAPNAPGMTVNTPTVPDNATVAQGTYKELHSFGNPAILAGQEKSFYLFEADNHAKAGESGMKATCLIVHVKFNSATPEGQALEASISPHFGYYRIDFRDYATDQFFDLLRNHHYVIETQSVDSPPAATPEDALNGQHTLKCRIVPWNQVQEEVKVPGNKRLTVDKREVYIPFSAATTGRPLTITTENTGGWTTADVPAWCTLSNTQTTTDGTVVLNIKATNKLYARGSFKLKAGAAEMEIKVKVGKLPPEYMSEYNLAGGSAYGYIPGTGATAAQTDGPLRWANDNQFGASGYYNWYVCTGTTDATHNPNGLKLFEDPLLKDKYHLPSAEEWGGILPPHSFIAWNSYTELTIDERLRHEKINIGGQKHTYKSEYKLLSPWKMSALRFQKGVQGANAEYPLAPDNSMVCAYFYELKSVNYPGGSSGSAVNIRVVYLGGDAAIPTINQLTLAWWQAQEQIPGRVFNYTIEHSGGLSPFPGNLSSGIPGGTIPGSVSELNTAFYFWTSSPPPPGTYQAWRHGYIALVNGASIGESNQYKYRGYSVRPFHNYDE
ncbi:BACON domain-containing protein [Bacteroides pyogenes]|uniref:BACON domain-containing protein n=1 Tax=Bacteroides pyogenes TaxID=310300 RepID=UPI002A917752|nr:BACON domain-containing protein [Bacteroides pyogenes]MDY5432525.1 BACON domain-containing protein [Bacteroides pyogenes]